MRTLLYRVILSCVTICLGTLYARGDASPKIDGMYYWLFEESQTAMFQSVDWNQRYDYPDVIIPDFVSYEGVNYKVTSIRAGAFRNNAALRSISISGNVEEIGNNAFQYCKNLESVRFEDSEKPIKVGYNDYKPLEEFDKKYQGLFHDCPIRDLYLGRETTLSYDGWDYSPFYVFEYNGSSYITNSLERVTIGNLVKSLPNRYFMCCKKLSSVVCGSGLKKIGDSCFDACESLMTVSLPDCLDEIGESAFRYCNSLTNIEIPENIRMIPDGTFKDCHALESVSFRGDIESLGVLAFARCKSLKEIYLGQSVKIIGNNCFESCWALSKIIHNSNIEYIGEYAFSNCGKLENFIIPNTIAALNDGTFANCSSLNHVAGMDHIAKLGKYLFKNCESLAYLDLSERLTVIPEGAFYNCTQLTNIKLGDNISVIEKDAFGGCSSLQLKKYSLNSIEEIGEGAFMCCSALEDLPKSSRLLNIGYEAFYGCDSFHKIIIPGSVKTLGDKCFSKCDKLTDIVIDNCDDEIELGLNLVYQSPLENLYIGRNFSGTPFAQSTVRNIEFGNKVTQIPANSFLSCNALTSIRIPNSVSSIGSGAFSRSNGVTAVYYAAVNLISGDKSIFSDDVYAKATLYVPFDAIMMSREIDPWKNFVCRTNYDFSGIEEVPVVKSDNVPCEVYNINGMPISKTIDDLVPGIYILRQGNIVKKIVVK